MATEDRRSRPFAEWLQEQRAGQSHSELSDALNELVEAVADTGKVGTLTLQVKVKPAGRGERTVLVADTITVKKPVAERAEVVFFVDGDHNLTRHNPDQQTLPLREVPKTAAADADSLKEAR